jgi:drug/metabolite transporter (DMT)-like permease
VRSTSLARAPATQTLLYQLLGAFGLLTVASVMTGQAHFNPTPQVWASLAFHAVVVSFASFLVWFWLLRHYLASRLGVFSFLTPLFGIVLGAWLLSEPIEASFLLGAGPVLLGIVLVSGHGWIRSVQQRLLTLRHPLLP